MHLRTALESRDVIGQAKGVVRMLTGCGTSAAFEVLAAISQDSNRKLRDIAALIADSAAARTPLPAEVSSSWKSHTAAATAAAAGGGESLPGC
nr:ANTAR domain-containing protein [Kineosporia mesophila]